MGGCPLVRHHDAAGHGVAFFVFAEGDGPLGERNLDAQFVETILQAAVEFPLQAPLRAGPDLHFGADDDGGFVQFLHALHFQRRDDVGAQGLVLGHFPAQGLDHRHHLIHVFPVGDADIHHHVGKILGVVDHRADLAEGHRVHGAGHVAQADGTNGKGFHVAFVAAHAHPIADRYGVLDEDEQAGDHVLDQGLGTEAHGQADHPGAGQKRADVDAQFGKHDQRYHHR